tara:strand:- start:1277 stop:1786 length:510 start_codon:yes stop_codon:yes gene_type:complete
MNKKNKIDHLCNHPNCELVGEYRAPKGYDKLNDYQWFCLEHIKEFNKKWNYHQKMGADEIETDIRFDTIWRRPTNAFGSGKRFYNFNINGEDMGPFENSNKPTYSSNKLLWSLSQLNLDINSDIKLIKKRYKELAKLHHPDVKGNSKKSIDKFRNIVEAYNYLLERYKK